MKELTPHQKAVETTKQRYGEDFYKKTGAKGNKFTKESAKAAYEKGIGKYHKAIREGKLKVKEKK